MSSINLIRPAAHQALGERTPIRETFYSPKYGLARPFSHYFLDWRPKKKMDSVYVYWENTSGNWVSGRGNSCIVDDILLLQKDNLLRRILSKNGRSRVVSKTTKMRNNRYLWNIDYFLQDPPYTLDQKQGIYTSPEGVHTWSLERCAKTEKD